VCGSQRVKAGNVLSRLFVAAGSIPGIDRRASFFLAPGMRKRAVGPGSRQKGAPEDQSQLAEVLVQQAMLVMVVLLFELRPVKPHDGRRSRSSNRVVTVAR